MRLALVIAMAVPATKCLREDEVDCEEAVKYMLECCPTFDRNTVQCSFSDTCGVTFPDLTPSESTCILDQSCEQIRENKICERVSKRGADAENPESPSGLGGKVCP